MTSHLSPKLSTAYARSVHYYVAGNYEAELIVNLILSRLERVKGSGLIDDKITSGPHAKRYVYDFAGITGHLAVRVDTHGRIVFAVYEIGKRRPVFLTAPNVWAHLNGYQGKILANDEIQEWSERLLSAAEVIEDDETRPEPPDAYLDRLHFLRSGNRVGDEYGMLEGDKEDIEEYEAALKKYKENEPIRRFRAALPFLPDPDDTENSTRGDEIWTSFERTLRHRLYLKRRRLMFRIWRHLVRRWNASAVAISDRTGKLRGWPCAIKAADVYLAKRLRVTRHAVARAIKELDKLGYIQAVRYEVSGELNKKGIYWYFPGDGQPREEPTRNPEITARGALAWIRKQSYGQAQGADSKKRA